MAQQHGEGCFCYDCVTQWAAQHDPNTGRRRSERASGPPIAKNPANQEYINKCWKEEQERKAAERSQRRRSGGGRRRITETVIGVALAAGGIVAEPPVKDVLDTGDAYERSRGSLVDNRDEYLDEQTRAANDRKGGSSRRR